MENSAKKKIYERKILLVYFYEQCFLKESKKKLLLFEKNRDKVIGNERDSMAGDDKAGSHRSDLLLGYYKDRKQEIVYIIRYHFSFLSPSVLDRSYIETMVQGFVSYKDEVRDRVNMYVVSFSYDEMDLIERIIFVLGYVEYMMTNTPREVVLNEMIELAKRYGSRTSASLINGIGHKILQGKEEENKT